MISGPGVVSASARPRTISPGCEPPVDLDGLLGDVGEHGVGAAEGDHGRAGEEQSLVDVDAVAAEQRGRDSTGAAQSDQADGEDARRRAGRRALGVQGVVGDQRRRAVVGSP